MFSIGFTSVYAFMLVFARMGGMILLNPIFTRRNIPQMEQIGFVFFLTLLIYPTVDYTILSSFTEFDLVFSIFKEVFIGFLANYVFQIFYYMLFFVGDIMDMQFGLSMAKVFDPSTNMQVSISSNIITLVFILYIFATNAHLVLLKIFASSYDIVGIGVTQFGLNFPNFIFGVFNSVFLLALKLLLPFLVAEFIVEISMGILMKVIPQIHVFVINIQTKILFGIFLLFAFSAPMAAFLDKYIIIMLENIQNSIYSVII